MANDEAVSVDVLAEGFCLAMANAYRLIEDGERLYRSKRYLGCIGAFTHAIDEIVKAQLLSKASRFNEEDAAHWRWLWGAIHNRKEKLYVLEHELHRSVFKTARAAEHMKRTLDHIKQEFVYVDYNPGKGGFVTPGGEALERDGDKALAKDIYDYALALFRFFNFHGLPQLRSVVQSFQHQREDAGTWGAAV